LFSRLMRMHRTGRPKRWRRKMLKRMLRKNKNASNKKERIRKS
jgi:hypothetical protein